jgi:SAM-dependent methyltransferase
MPEMRMSTKPAKVDLYDNAYGHYDFEVYGRIRVETYGEDLGLTSWVSCEEAAEIPQLLGLTQQSSALEIGCGSGKYAIRVAHETGCRVVGLDVNQYAIENARVLAQRAGFESRIAFVADDANKALPFADCALEAVFSNDAVCHIPGRANLLSEVARVLKPGGRLLFSDALVIGGMVSHEEIATRSAIGHYVFSPPGENERLIEAAGLKLISTRDTTPAAATISWRWLQAREARKSELIGIEGEANFYGLQHFLECVRALTAEKRLLRYLYLARKEA